ncbi:Golgi-associated plant pathogenesis-related protein 1-like [Mercenaria mercenaria]|uniref:Golgi-associated plant pathogenesis-related protein 1-like n=1 Tax=Mercenaria mercenaria TaxID=6596 RepID=UPI00234EF680|nr:Golgi-associated plant pathogenesis-related protein 1-like [Mercenaria mercenaria]
MGCGSSTADNSATTRNETQPKPTTNDNTPTRNETQPKPKPDTGNQFMNDAIASHNKYRAIHGAPEMQPAQELIDYAQKYANDLAKRDTMEHSKCTLPSGGRIGENLYCYWSSNTTESPTAEMAVSSWYDEIKDYNFNNPGFGMNTGHFTQVVWKGSTELGMAWAKASGGTTYVVANYRPAGNMMGDFEQNVLPKQ